MSEWRTIDSAPRDRRQILAYVPDEIGDYTRRIAFWDDDDEPSPFWRYTGEMEKYCRAHPPSHWQPLPDPPQGAKA